MERTFSLQTVENHTQFESLAHAFGNFQNQLSDFDASKLSETIPDFHNTVKRYRALEAAAKKDTVGRAGLVSAELAFAEERKKDAGILTDCSNEKSFLSGLRTMIQSSIMFFLTPIAGRRCVLLT